MQGPFITSSIYLLSSSERMNGMLTIFSISPAFRVIVNFMFDDQIADVIIDVTIFRAIQRLRGRLFIFLNKALDDGGKIRDFELVLFLMKKGRKM
jgi:hypothetical protein